MKKEVCLNQIASYSKGKQINTNDLIGDAKYFYLNGGVYPSGKWDSYNVKGDTVTISEGGNSSGYVNYMSSPFWCGAHCYYLYDLKCNPKYLYYALKSQQDRLMAIRSGACMPNIKKSDLGKFVLRIDDDNYVQEKAIIVFDSLSGLIENRKKQLEQLDLLIKSRFVEMFGDPISNPMDFPIKTLNQLSSLITNGNTPKGGNKNYVEKGILFIRSQNVWRNKIVLDDVAYIDEATHQNMQKSSVMHNDILITKTGRVNTENSSLGRAALYLGSNNSANINGHVYLIRLKHMIKPEFVIAILTSEAYKKYIRKVCVGGIDKRQINLDQVEEFPIIIPPIERQNEFAEFVGQVEKSKTEVQKALDEAQLLFDSLMQEYFG